MRSSPGNITPPPTLIGSSHSYYIIHILPHPANTGGSVSVWIDGMKEEKSKSQRCLRGRDSTEFESGKEQHCYTSITKSCQTQRTSLETSTYPSLPLRWKLFGSCNYLEMSRIIFDRGFQLSCQHIVPFQSTPAQQLFSLRNIHLLQLYFHSRMTQKNPIAHLLDTAGSL